LAKSDPFRECERRVREVGVSYFSISNRERCCLQKSKEERRGQVGRDDVRVEVDETLCSLGRRKGPAASIREGTDWRTRDDRRRRL